MPPKNDVSSELMGLVAGRKQQASVKSRVSELFSSSSDEEEEDSDISDYLSEEEFSPVVTDKRKASKDNRRKDESDDEGEEEESVDGFGPDLMGDEGDRQRLSAMTEVEREAILYERAQTRLAKAERRDLEKKMRELENASSRPARAPSAATEMKRRTLDQLKAKREKRKRRTNSDSDYYEDGEEDGEVRGNGKVDVEYEGDDQHSSRNDDQYRSSRNHPATTTKKQQSSSTEIVSLEGVNKLLMTRNTLAKWIFHPEFDELSKGRLVRLSVGFKGEEQVYRLVEIKKIVKYHRNYKLNETTTNKAAILKYGRNEKTFRLDVTSNSPFTKAEFERWVETMKEEHQPIITKRTAEGRVEAWRRLEESPVSDEVVSAMVAAKRELGSAPRNLIAERAMLVHLRDEAHGINNKAEVDRIDEELALLSKELESQPARQGTDRRLEALAELNKRNRRFNVVAAGEAEKRNNNKKTYAEIRHDPFSRRKCQPSTFTDFITEGDVTGDKSNQNAIEVPEQQSDITPVTTPTVTTTNAIDLFAAAKSVDIDIDI